MRNSGFTIIELMIASALVAIVMVFTLQSFTVSNRTYVKIDSVVDVQQSLRAVANVIERDLRHAGMMVPEGAALCGIDSTTEPDRLYISDYTAVNPETALGYFDGARITGGVTQVNQGVTTLALDSLVIEPGTPDPSYDTDGNGVNDSDFRENGGVIITDRANPNRGSVCGIVQDVNLATPAIEIDIKTASMTPLGGGVTPELIAVPALEYRIDGTKLYRNNLLLADGVEDLQLAYFIDANGNNSIDVGELRGTPATGYASGTSDASDLKAVRLNVVGRTRLEDERFTQGFIQLTENRTAGGAVQDGFRRRVHTSVVRMRNVGDRAEGT